MLLALMCSLKLMRLMRVMQLVRLMRLMQLMRLMRLVQPQMLRLARSVVILATRTAVPAGALSTAKIENARDTGKAYLIPRLINWNQLVSLIPLYPLSWSCVLAMFWLVMFLGHVSWSWLFLKTCAEHCSRPSES